MPPDPAHAHDVAVVAKSRDVFRPSVADAIAGGLRPAIYGSGWEPFVDPALVVSDYVPNEELPVVYSSVGVLLNDHWETMHEWGFVSNRLFDALACETPVISDDLPEIAELFDGAVLTYRDAAELRELVDATLADPTGGPRARRARARADRRAATPSTTAPSSCSTRWQRHGLDARDAGSAAEHGRAQHRRRSRVAAARWSRRAVVPGSNGSGTRRRARSAGKYVIVARARRRA